MGDLRLKGVAISTMAGVMELGDPQLRPFWVKAERSVPSCISTLAAIATAASSAFTSGTASARRVRGGDGDSSLMYDGVLEAPQAQICISHGGGYMPFYMGRIDRNYLEKANTRVNEQAADRLSAHAVFRSCVYETAVLKHLVDKVGADRVLLDGTTPWARRSRSNS
jgi:aminocarboxymuconate-semialdehyde decarboxylase